MAGRMSGFRCHCLLPVLLLGASLLDWSLISLVNMIIFFAFRFSASRRGFRTSRSYLLLWCTIIYSALAILAQVVFHIIWCVEGKSWHVAHSWWAKLVGFIRDQPWGSASVVYFVVVQLSAALVALVEVLGSRIHQDSCWLNFSFGVEQIGYHLRVACCLLLPAIQLVVSISHPSWISLPFFVFSCIGLADWSLTSNFLGLFRWWRPLEIYSVLNILLLYIYQLPVKFPNIVIAFADFVGLFKISLRSAWPELSSGIALLVYYFMLSSAKRDIQEMDSLMSLENDSLTERLLPSRHAFLVCQSRSGKRHANVLLTGSVFRTFSINFFTYGFPVLLLALSFWSFNFTSICAFGLLAYVGYILYAFPSLFQMHRLNGSLLVFILLWAASTYVFNVAFTSFNKRFQKDMMIWETIGLWHYSIPGLFLLAQFCLGVFVALCNLVNNSVFLYLTSEDGPSSSDDHLNDEKEDTKVLIVATLAWGLRKLSRAITLALLFLLVMKPGFIHAAYMCFFLVFLVSHSISKKLRQLLVIFSEMHFSVLYILQLDLVSSALERGGSLTMEVLSQLGLTNHANIKDFLEIGSIVCFCAVHSHGFKMLFSLSAVLQHTPYTPVGFSILKAGLNKSVLLSVYNSPSSRSGQAHSNSHEKKIASYLSKISQKILSVYRSYGTYVAFLTILLTLYLVTPNYISFGYLFFLLFWIIGRQIVEKAKRRLWFPLKVYAVVVFIFTYCLSISPIFAVWVSKLVNLYPDLGFNPDASLLENVWQSLAVLIVMQLYSYERRQNRDGTFGVSDASKPGVLGFLRRLLIWHSEKILSIAVFYACLSSISLAGLVYLLGLIVCSTLPKVSRIPSKVYLVYTGILAASEYLFQMWCKPAQMCPGQRLHGLSVFLGLKYYDYGFWGIESGLRGKVLVIVACTIQYNVFHWLDLMPASLVHLGKWEEPCQLFISSDISTGTVGHTEENLSSKKSTIFSRVQGLIASSSTSSFSSGETYQTSESVRKKKGLDEDQTYSFANIWGISKESHKWDKKRIVALKRERFETQKTTFKIYMKFWIENLFKLRGLEVNMVVLLLASFTLLNVISIFYVMCLVVCILMNRDLIRKLWPLFVFLFASVLILEYFALWKETVPWFRDFNDIEVHCRQCWKSSRIFVDYCSKCWLGLIVDDPRMLVSYYIVFLFSSFKLRSDQFSGFSDSYTYRQMRSQRKNALVWKDLSLETKSFWTFLDYLRLYAYCHLLDIVLALIAITGTLEYDVLHLGYLGFALVFFRMRLEILKKKNKIFKYLRMYNFALIVLSLAYQSPYLGEFSSGKCDQIDYLYEVIGLYKYDYGFKITSRSAFVEIVIFLLVSVQSYIFGSSEFDYVARYLEAEQIGAMVHEQEKKALKKTEQLQHLRKSEEQKRQRNMQVEKMKSEMHNLQIQLNRMNSFTTINNTSQNEGLRRRKKGKLHSSTVNPLTDDEVGPHTEQDKTGSAELFQSFEFAVPDTQKNLANVLLRGSSDLQRSPIREISEEPLPTDSARNYLDSTCEIVELGETDDTTDPNLLKGEKGKGQHKENPLKSAVQLIGDGVSQVQSLGNQAVTNIVTFLNIDPNESQLNEHSAEHDVYDDIESQTDAQHAQLTQAHSDSSETAKKSPAIMHIGVIFRYIWSQMRSNYDYVCYCCFVLVFLWNFSLLSMVYLAALFLYALCVNSGPTYLFWVIILIYTELNILCQYIYQIIIQHCGLNIHLPLLQRFGFPEDKIKSSFVVGILPLFLVYISTLLQSSITAKDGEWVPVTEFSFLVAKNYNEEKHYTAYNWKDRLQNLLLPIGNLLRMIRRGLSRYWKSLTQGAESPPYFVQLTMEVNHWPEDGIQPERIESAINRVLAIAHEERCFKVPSSCHSCSKVRIQSIEPSQENPNMALAVLEVVYAAPANCQAAEWYRSLTPAAHVEREIHESQRAGLFEEIDFPYPIVSVIGGGKREIDLYAYYFGADLAVFFLVAMFYQSVLKNKSEFLDVYQLEDQFPKEFVFILMVLFFLIVVDRIIYLWSFATGKVVLYLFNLVLFTYSVTEYAWGMEPSHRDIGGLVLRAIYLTKSISFALQALQIRYGIPNKSTLYRQFLTSKVTQVNYLGFRLYRALPFLYELRCVLDWSCTSTSLTMYDWLKLEDIYASLFLVKCDAVLNRANHRQGEKQTKMTKFCSGICLFFILICVIWAPMLIYSSGNPTNIANPVMDVTIKIDIKAVGGRLTFFKTTACEKVPWKYLKAHASVDPLDYLGTYNVEDIQLICCQPDATTTWLIPPRVQNRFMQSMEETQLAFEKMELILTWDFLRARPKGKESVKYESPVDHCPSVDDVKQVLNGTANCFRIIDAYPRYLRVTASGEVRRLEAAIDSVSGNLCLNDGASPWWSFYDTNPSDLAGCKGLNGPMAIVISEETPQGIIGETLSKFSIWSLYITFVLAVARFIRLQCSDLRMRIPFENLPSCDRLIDICEGIYAARAEGELEVEEVLYWTLVNIYRSPHMLLEYTKPD